LNFFLGVIGSDKRAVEPIPDILFTKETNNEQIEIIKSLYSHRAVVAQGPPGTGKTHTIANLLGHFLAEGKNVLITSQTKKALDVLKEKIPTDIQDLCISMLDDDSNDLGNSVESISEKLGYLNLEQLKNEYEEIERNRNELKEDIKNIIVDCAGIFIIVIGIKSALVAQKDIMILIYLITGAVIGQLINIDKKIKDFSQFLENKFLKEKNSLNNEKSFAKGFSTATILYCVGAMAILGSINSGLTNDNTILNIKAILDGVISIVLTSIYGIGVIFSAFLVFLYQGIFYLFASQIKDYLNPQAISELNAVGGVLVLAIGINMTFKKDIKTANMLPAIFIPLIVSIFS